MLRHENYNSTFMKTIVALSTLSMSAAIFGVLAFAVDFGLSLIPGLGSSAA